MEAFYCGCSQTSATNNRSRCNAILPQAISTRYGLTVGATAAPLVRLLLWFFFPIAYPISKVLDWMLGKGHAALLRRAELKTYVDFHGNEAGKGGDLTHDETTIIAGAFELTEKTTNDAMTPISKAFSLDMDGTLTLWVYILIFILYNIQCALCIKSFRVPEQGYLECNYDHGSQ